MDTKPGKLDIGKYFGDLAKRALDLLAQAAIAIGVIVLIFIMKKRR